MSRTSPLRDARVQCLGKARHRNRAAAMAQAKRLSGVEPYRCPHCQGWHVGHASGSILKRQFQR